MWNTRVVTPSRGPIGPVAIEGARRPSYLAVPHDGLGRVITLGVQDAAAAQRLDTVFEKYAPRCKEIELEAWGKRGRWHKLKDNVFYLLNELL